jgi:MoaA/NifB/PqqE/SkfB family radical SAM enzyme
MALNLTQLRRKFEKVRQGLPRHIPLTQSTFCPRLWTDAFINDRGDVYFCCHMQPHTLGNLHHASLEELWNNFKTRQMRRLALTRTLLCYDRCRLLDEQEFAARPGPDTQVQAPYSDLKRIKLLIGELCNIQCIMCDQDHRSKRQLPLELLQNNIDWTHLEDIELQGGEPMAMKNAKDLYVWLTEEKGKKVNFLTNGTLMPEDWAERICRGSNWLYFSINGVEPATFERVNDGAKFDRVRRTIARVLEAREKTGSKIELVGHFTMVEQNVAELDRFPALAKELGLDRVDFGYDMAAVPLWLEQHPDEKARLARSFAELLANPVIPMRTHRLVMLGILPPTA